MIEDRYQPQKIEQEIQKIWEEKACFQATETLDKEKFYCLSMFPYPSGHLHMGHMRNYTIGDVVSRYQRMLDKNVLQPIGWDAFGLPAENAAIKNNIPPVKWTRENIDHMRTQLKRLGLAYDWNREIATCHPEYYRWEQWLFIKMLEKGLVYRKNSIVNWDPVDQTVLANEQVIDGRGWRSGALVEQREIAQWFLKITDYADQLLNDLNTLKGWPEQVRTMQRNWIGRSEGVEIHFRIPNEKQTLKVYTTRPDTLYGVTFLAIATQHPLAKKAASKNKHIQEFITEAQHHTVSEADLATLEKKGIDTGIKAIHPLTQEEIPIWITNYVLMEYGSGAVMAVSGHDERDYDFAKKYNLPIKAVIALSDQTEPDVTQQAFTEKGPLIHSGEFTGLNFEDACNGIAKKLIELQAGKRQTHYRLRDWGISRQRYWGAPIPIIHCEVCGTVPVPEKDLPVLLPEEISFDETQSPLHTMPEFYETTCPKCGKPAKRETDTFDTFMESSWYYARFACPDQKNGITDERANYWTPVDQYIGGVEHAILHLMYARFIHKVLRDLGALHSDEPFTNLLTQGMVLKDGHKMSKSKGNTVDPQELIDQYGADTARVFIIFASPPEQSLEWSDSGVEGAYRFLKRVWSFAYEHQESLKNVNIDQKELSSSINWESIDNNLKAIRREMYTTLKQATFDMERLQLNTVISACMKLLNTLQKLSNIQLNLKDNTNKTAQHELIQSGLPILLRMLYPIAPHITQHIWEKLNITPSIMEASWPTIPTNALKSETLSLVIQINGKLRNQITVPHDAEKEEIEKIALEDTKVQTSIQNKTIKKIIMVKGRLINIVIGD